MAKKLFLALMALSLATAAFASGQNEKAQAGVFQGDKLVLKGTVSFQAYPHAILKSGDKQYVLMVPPFLVAQSGARDGDQVSVQGYQLRDFPGNPWAGTDKNLVGLFVTQATVGGKDYDLGRYYGEWMMAGRGRGMFGGYGRGFGMRGPGYGPGPGMMGQGYGRGFGMRGPGYGPGAGQGPWGDWD
ncbi:MAG TPA: hypothetical protein VMM82_02400 [Spirochaetia bacterium]|nr:hypothetical protein [Spirochaetia bacterium]